MRSIVSGDYYRNFNIEIHKETPLRSKPCGKTSPARYLLPSVVSAGRTKRYLITTIDDRSRRSLHGDLGDKESSWTHIVAQKAVLTQFGCPLKYYVDNHSIFRYVEKRDSVWRKFETTEEQALVQWKEVLKDLRVEVVYVLSPAAKGKGERPYEWLQDHLVRTCVREGHHQVRSSSSTPL